MFLLLWFLPIWGALLILVAALALRGTWRLLALLLGPPLLFAVMALNAEAAFFNGNLLAALVYTCGWIALLYGYPVILLGVIAYAMYRYRHRERRAPEIPEKVPNLRDF